MRENEYRASSALKHGLSQNAMQSAEIPRGAETCFSTSCKQFVGKLATLKTR